MGFRCVRQLFELMPEQRERTGMVMENLNEQRREAQKSTAEKINTLT